MSELQWGHDWGVVERLIFPVSVWFRCAASMGPRLGSRGKSASGRVRAGPLVGFNGATTGESWKGAYHAAGDIAGARASMGPRLGSRGEAAA